MRFLYILEDRIKATISCTFIHSNRATLLLYSLQCYFYFTFYFNFPIVSHRGVPPGITSCLVKESLQPSAVVNGLTALSVIVYRPITF